MGAVSAKCGPLIRRRGGTNSHNPRIASGEQHGSLAVVARRGDAEPIISDGGSDASHVCPMSVVIVGDSARRHAVCPYQHFAAELGVGARDTRVHYGHHGIGIAGCHTPSGRGVDLLWPPLLGREEWIVGVDKRPIHIVGLCILYTGYRLSLTNGLHD